MKLVDIMIAIAYLCLGAGTATAIWLRVFRRHVSWWQKHCERIECETDESLQSMSQVARRASQVARRAIDLNEKYGEYLRGKIVITDPSVRRRAVAKA